MTCCLYCDEYGKCDGTCPCHQKDEEINVDDICLCQVMPGCCRIHPKIGG